MAKHSVQRKRKKRGNGFSFGSAVVLVLCFIGVSFGLYLWQAAFSIGQPTPTVDDDDFRPTIGEPPYRIVIDAGHGGSDPGARGVVQESEMTTATAEALSAWLERDPNYIPLTTGTLNTIAAFLDSRPACFATLVRSTSRLRVATRLFLCDPSCACTGFSFSGSCFPPVSPQFWFNAVQEFQPVVHRLRLPTSP